MEEVTKTIATYFAALHECNAEKFHAFWHPHGLLLGVAPDGSVVARDAAEFCAGVVARGASADLAAHDKILSIEIIDATCASAKVQIALPPAPTSPTPTTSPTLYTDFLTLLRDPAIGSGGEWRVISKIYSSAPLDAATDNKLLPHDFADVAAAVWDGPFGYAMANRARDAAAMAKVFHPFCNLTFATPGGVVVVDCKSFLDRVANRWSVDVHAPYAHLKDDPRAASADTLVSMDFIGPSACRVVLKVGFPPFLYTDVLLLLKLGAACGEGREEGGWWIVAKSSGNVPFMAEDKM